MVRNPLVPRVLSPIYMEDQAIVDYQEWKKKQKERMDKDHKHRKTRLEHYMRSKTFKINFRLWQKRVLKERLDQLTKSKKGLGTYSAIDIINEKLEKVNGWLEKNVRRTG